MKKIAFILIVLLALNTNVLAEVYHGIDIDEVYKNGDWNNKEEIIEIIDDYTLLLQYQKKLDECIQDNESLSCLDELAEDIIKHFYVGNTDENLKFYRNYVKASYAVYGTVYCLNKYNVPAGTMCNQENEGNTQRLVKQYIQESLSSIKNILIEHSFIKRYKD